MKKDQAKKILSEVQKGSEFKIGNRKIRSIEELNHILPSMSKNEFSKKVSGKKNEIASWVNKSIKDPILSEKIKNSKSQKEMSNILSKYVANLRFHARGSAGGKIKAFMLKNPIQILKNILPKTDHLLEYKPLIKQENKIEQIPKSQPLQKTPEKINQIQSQTQVKTQVKKESKNIEPDSKRSSWWQNGFIDFIIGLIVGAVGMYVLQLILNS